MTRAESPGSGAPITKATSIAGSIGSRKERFSQRSPSSWPRATWQQPASAARRLSGASRRLGTCELTLPQATVLLAQRGSRTPPELYLPGRNARPGGPPTPSGPRPPSPLREGGWPPCPGGQPSGPRQLPFPRVHAVAGGGVPAPDGDGLGGDTGIRCGGAGADGVVGACPFDPAAGGLAGGVEFGARA
jgi:hypothetical protein